MIELLFSCGEKVDSLVDFVPQGPITTIGDITSPTVLSITRIDANPTASSSVAYRVLFSESVSGVDALDFSLTSSTVTSPSITAIVGSGTTYDVTVDTGSNDGILDLTLIDNDTIIDAAGNKLGGLGFSNGDYLTGEQYTVAKSYPLVNSIVRVSSENTNALSADFSVNFTKSVTGVDAADFTFTGSGVTTPSITAISPATGYATAFTITVNTGSGDGLLKLNILDNDTILDTNVRPLGDNGLGNGDYTAGQTYSVDKTTPTVTIANSGSALYGNPNVTVAGACETGLAVTLTGNFTGSTISGITCSGGNYSQSVALETPDGGKNITASQTDAAGNAGTTGAVSFTRDILPPTVTITNSGLNLYGTPDVTVTGACETGINVTISGLITGSPITGITCSGGAYSQLVSLTTPDGGSIIITAAQTDLAGNAGGSGDVSFTRDTTGPSAPTGLSSTYSIAAISADLSWTASTDTAGIGEYQFQLFSDSVCTSALGSVVNTTFITYTVNNSHGLSTGPEYFKVRAKDTVGNWGNYSSCSASFTVPVYAFATSASYTGDLMTAAAPWNPTNGIDAGKRLCQQIASNIAGGSKVPQGVYYAVLAINATPPNFPYSYFNPELSSTPEYNIYNTNGAIVRDDSYCFFSGVAHQAAINYDEKRQLLTTPDCAWTNTASTGAASDSGNNCSGWASTSGFTDYGLINSTTSWAYSNSQSCATACHLYCVGQNVVLNKYYVFATNASWTGNLGGLSGANTKCATAASNVVLPSPSAYRAILATTVDATTLFNGTAGPVYNLRPIANGGPITVMTTMASFFAAGTLTSAVNYSENGTNLGAVDVWTGTTPYGTNSGATCTNWNSSAATAHYGIANISTTGATNWLFNNSLASCALTKRLYCTNVPAP